MVDLETSIDQQVIADHERALWTDNPATHPRKKCLDPATLASTKQGKREIQFNVRWFSD